MIWQDGDRQNGAAARRGGAAAGDRDVDMEVSFMPGLDLGQQLYEKRRDKQSRQAETVWQAYERRRKCADIISVAEALRPPASHYVMRCTFYLVSSLAYE